MQQRSCAAWLQPAGRLQRPPVMIMTVMLMTQKASALQRSTMTPRRLSQYEVVCMARDERSAGALTNRGWDYPLKSAVQQSAVSAEWRWSALNALLGWVSSRLPC